MDQNFENIDIDNNPELQQAIEEYKKIVSEIKMHQTMAKAAVETIQKTKDAMASLAIRLSAVQMRIVDITGSGKEVSDVRRQEEEGSQTPGQEGDQDGATTSD